MRITSTGSVLVTMSSSPAVIGTCSECGGRVCVPTFVLVGHTDTTPVCADCGARRPDPAHGPLVQMSPPGPRRA